jgi:anionic cell wall polymer biosynthesis LytR-Cps2A-Psr (LCP) family protein
MRSQLHQDDLVHGDLYVEFPGKKNNRLNAAYVYGGADLLIKTLKQNFGVDVDYLRRGRFLRAADVIDQIGGLTVTVGRHVLSTASTPSSSRTTKVSAST